MRVDWAGYAQLLEQFPEQHKRILEEDLGDLEGCALPPPIRLEVHHTHHHPEDEDECLQSH